jgi:hypothetical protein
LFAAVAISSLWAGISAVEARGAGALVGCRVVGSLDILRRRRGTHS